MNSQEIRTEIARMYDSEAAMYDARIGYGIQCESERSAWVRDLFSAVSVNPGTVVLECGIGTGAFARIWLEQGCFVTGIDISNKMIQQIKQNIPTNLAKKLRVLDGAAENELLFKPETFDLIVCRQFVCHLPDPLMVFRNCRSWLRPSGKIIIIEGMWDRSQWEGRDDLVDNLPLSCVHTRATINYLLSTAHFEVEKNIWMDDVNKFLDTSKHSKRYLIIARKL